MALQNLRSSTPSKRPDASSMSDGQIALNTAAASAGLFFKDSNGDLVKTGPVHIGTTAPNSTPATGGSTGNSKGEAWLDTANGNYVLKIYDGTAWQSVEIAAGSARQLLQTNAAGTDVEFTSNVDVPGTLDVTGATTLDSTASVAGVLSANGKISFAEGNSAAPGIYPGSDTDTGISSPSLNELSFSTAGTSRLYIDSSGEIGVGTTTPGYALDVRSGDGRFKRSASNDASIYLGNTSNNYIYGNSDANIIAVATNGSEKLRIDSSGNVGIGTSSPSQRLEISGNTSIIGGGQLLMQNTNRVQWGTSDSAYISGQEGGSGYIKLGVGGDRVTILNSGNVGIGTSSPTGVLNIQSNTAAGPSLTYDSANVLNLDYGIVQLAAGIDPSSPFGGYLQARDNTNGARVLSLNPAGGNVGIGRTNPDHKLDLYGGTLGTTASNSISLARLSGNSGNGDDLKFEHKRISNGTSWVTAAHKIFRKVDITDKNYIQFGFDTLEFGYGGSEGMRLDSTGRLGIGATDPGNYGKLFVKGGQAATSYSSAAFMTPGSAQGERADLALYSTFQNTGDSGPRRSADIVSGFNGGAWGNEYLAFHVGNNGAGNDARAVTAEKARINGSGFFRASNNGAYDNVNGTYHEFRSTNNFLTLLAGNGNAGGSGYQCNLNSSNTSTFYFLGYSTSSNLTEVVIYSNGNIVNQNNSYGSISDIKFKENIVDAKSQWNDIKALRPVNYNLKNNPNLTQLGLIAQEVELVSPGLVNESPDLDETGQDLGTTSKSINYSVLYMKAVKALQEAMERIETLEQRLNDAGL